MIWYSHLFHSLQSQKELDTIEQLNNKHSILMVPFCLPNIRCIIENARAFQKNIYFCFIHYPKAFDCVDNNKLCGKFWKRWEYQTTWPASWETYMQVRKQQLELDMEQQTGSK